jgi:hypothetical protein
MDKDAAVKLAQKLADKRGEPYIAYRISNGQWMVDRKSWFTEKSALLQTLPETIEVAPGIFCDFHKKFKAPYFCKYDGIALCIDCARGCMDDGHPVLTFKYMHERGIEY